MIIDGFNATVGSTLLILRSMTTTLSLPHAHQLKKTSYPPNDKNEAYYHKRYKNLRSGGFITEFLSLYS